MFKGMKSSGLIHIYTGEGKGKTTASLGLALRAAGAGLKVLIVQFFKEDSAESGEKEFFQSDGFDALGVDLELKRANCRHPMFTGKRTDKVAVQASVTDAFALIKERVGAGGIDLLVCDEILSAINGGWLALDEVIEFLETKPVDLEVAFTGRDAPVELQKMADYVTEMLKIKHPYDTGLPARKGIEF
ncbi:MAG: cob(I)yrinic acid a,c-diamide adenosyltransferase [Proteobacteria bacterium]|nr:cob(I)yrinic acid a,c-diamide adenosyltransferase [Pseudomonadota bacterium]